MRKNYFDLRGLWYRGSRYHCPCCEKNYRTFLPMKEGANQRPNVVCPGCAVVERHRLLVLFLKSETDIFQKPHRVLYFAPEYSLQEKLRKQPNIDYLSTDIDSTLAMQLFDIQDIPHTDNSFSMIFCSHVLAHVKDDKRALRELFRVLEKNGCLIILDQPADIPKTIEDKKVKTAQERLQKFGQEDRWRLYGNDFVERLSEPGFEVEVIDLTQKLSPKIIEKNGLLKNELIYCCWKRT